MTNDADARKSVAQDQIGVVLEQVLNEATTLSARIYAGTRTLDNALSIPLAALDAVPGEHRARPAREKRRDP